jgi:hypothetical protein
MWQVLKLRHCTISYMNFQFEAARHAHAIGRIVAHAIA